MFTNKLALSLAALLSISVSDVHARFLGANDTSQPLIISPRPTSLTYSNALQCGECILGGYVFCAKGPEQYTGSVPLSTFCCQNKATCAQATDKLWSCSSKYENNTLEEKFRVCPFDVNQCGPQNVSFNQVGNSQCLRLNNIKKGNTCLYRVQSQCGVPKVMVNDTSSGIFFSTRQLTNQTIAPPMLDSARCFAPRSQSCLCKSSSNVVQASGNLTNQTNTTYNTKYVCDCETALNTQLNASQCNSCNVIRDSFGNTLRQCSCNLVAPIQVSEDQSCQCQRVTDLITKASSLNCTCAKPVPARSVSLSEESCKCVTSFNASTKSSYLDCVCKNAPICPDPLSLVPVPPAPTKVPCTGAYPCECSQNGTSSQCRCLNPSSGIQALTTLNSSQCSCQLRIQNSSFTNDCKCCLQDDFVRANLLAPVTCGPTALKEDCQCTNTSVTVGKVSTPKQSCNCTHPQTSVVVSNVAIDASSSCDCSNNTLGTKACKCCVAQPLLGVQLQPKCALLNNVSTQESLQCSQASNGLLSCNFISRRAKNNTYMDFAINATQCYCAPSINNSTLRACNCCVADATYLANKQNCPVAKEVAECVCDSANGSLSCDCVNRLFFNTITTKIPLSAQSCSCFPAQYASGNGTITRNSCTCCTGETDLVKPLPLCKNPSVETLVKCDNCANVTVNGTNKYVCNCAGSSVFDNKTPFQYQSVDVTASTCSCISAGRNTCDCCLKNNIWALAKPACQSSQTSEKCQCKNSTISYRQNVTTQFKVNKTVTFNCRPTGCSGEICGNTNLQIESSCVWKNSYACYANAACEYQQSTGDCGWTLTPAVNTCITKSAVASAALFQNVTRRNATSRDVVVQVNTSRVDLMNFTNNSFACNCSNSRFPRFNLTNAPITANQCGCGSSSNATLKACDCCTDRKTVNELFLNAQNCSAASIASNCVCTNSSCQCTSPVDKITYGDLRFSNSCNCIVRPDGNQDCKCCLPRNFQLPAAPVCSSGAQTFNNCTCDLFGGNYKCACNNGTNARNVINVQNITTSVVDKTTRKNQTVTTQSVTNTTVFDPIVVRQVLPYSRCSCVTRVNGTVPTRTCNCCLQKPVVCAATAVNTQNCACQNITNTTTKTWQWNCGCTRQDNSVTRNFIFDKSACTADAFGQSYQCCLSKPQYESQIQVLTCANNTQRQGCQCSFSVNPATNKTEYVCGCNRADNMVRGNFLFGADTCLCNGNGSSCACCVPQSLVQTQIPRKSCFAEGNDTIAQFCDCKSLNITQNGTRSVVNSCNCTNTQFLVTRTMNFTQTQCLCQPNNTKCECCLSSNNRKQLIPQAQCAPSDINQGGCSCTNVTRNGGIQQTCGCKLQYQGKQYTIADLTTSQNGCACNGTDCACCLSAPLVEQVTQKVCLPSETKSICSCSDGTVSKVTNKTEFNCSCTTYTRDFTVFNYTYNGLNQDQCLCRNQSSCTCCIADRNPAPAAPMCNVTNSSTIATLPKCQCFPGVNGTNVCNCTRTAGSVETYNNNITLNTCNCLSVNRTNGNKSPLECSCCASPDQITTPAPFCPANSTSEQCLCLNINDAKGRKGYNCDCNYKNIFKMKEFNFPADTQCSCSNTNTLLKPCQCCVSVQNYRDSTAPKCDASASGVSVCDNIIVNNTKPVRGNCATTLNVTGVIISYSAVNVTLNSSQCGCYNDEFGKQICRCCNVASQDITKGIDRQCRPLDQLSSYCECPVFAVNQTSANCSCALRSNGFSYNFASIRQNASDCSCVLAKSANKTSQQCSCCSSKAIINNLAAPVCNANLMSNQRCNCRQVFNATRKAFFDVCDCTNQTAPLALSVSQQCSCINQTNADGVNSQNCICCAPNPPLGQCQRLALPNADSIGCRCVDTVVNGRAVFSCNCTKQINATTQLTRNSMLYDEARDCCCQERQDPITRKGFKQCNCTFASVKQPQNCQCKVSVTSSGMNITTCNCTDCNKVVTPRVPSLGQCQCQLPVKSVPRVAGPLSNFTNSTPSVVPVNTTVKTSVVNTTNSTSSVVPVANLTNSTGKVPAVNTTNSTVKVPVVNTTSSTNMTSTNATKVNSTSTVNTTIKVNSTSNMTANTSVRVNGTLNATTPGAANTTVTPVVTPSMPTVLTVPCSCQVDFQGFCPQVDMLQQAKIDEGSCQASNSIQSPFQTLDANCNNQYEYLVAVVATNQDASTVLMQMQSYQYMSAKYIQLSVMLILASIMLVLY